MTREQETEILDKCIDLVTKLAGKRPHVLMMLERPYHHMIRHPGVRFLTMNEMADDFARRFPRKK
jgi:hypothetical protein